jgi:ATP sulfurylase
MPPIASRTVPAVPNFIPTLIERKPGGIQAFAFCPVCDRVEHSHDQENQQERALTEATDKIRRHMRSSHNPPPCSKQNSVIE